jgi:hypothetical protein
MYGLFDGQFAFWKAFNENSLWDVHIKYVEHMKG